MRLHAVGPLVVATRLTAPTLNAQPAPNPVSVINALKRVWLRACMRKVRPKGEKRCDLLIHRRPIAVDVAHDAHPLLAPRFLFFALLSRHAFVITVRVSVDYGRCSSPTLLGPVAITSLAVATRLARAASCSYLTSPALPQNRIIIGIGFAHPSSITHATIYRQIHTPPAPIPFYPTNSLSRPFTPLLVLDRRLVGVCLTIVESTT